MLVEIGTIVAVYAIARLIQVPIEFMGGPNSPGRSGLRNMLVGISMVGAAAILFLLIALWSHGPYPEVPSSR